MNEWIHQHCTACRSGEVPLGEAELTAALIKLENWMLCSEDGVFQIQRTFRFADFLSALEFTKRVGLLAESENHHPLLITEWGKVTVKWWTHKIRGCHANDLIMAVKTDQIADGV